MSKKITLKEAKRLSILKWEMVVKGKIDNVCEQPELMKLKHYCGFCELFWDEQCKGCPLFIDDKMSCNHHDHPFNKWAHGEDIYHAKDVLNLVINSKI